MPELPEVETTVRAINKFENNILNRVIVHNKNLRWKVEKKVQTLTKKQLVRKITRRAKYILMHLDDQCLMIHLGMSGKLRIQNVKDNYFKKHDHAELIFENEKIVFNDVRRFGFLKLYNNKNLNEIPFIKKLGIEPLSKSFNVVYFKKKIENKKKNIKNILMDQTFLSGLGNIYVNEALFLARINPLRKCKTLKTLEIKKLIFSIKLVLKSSIKKGGSSIKDFKNSIGKSGSFQQFSR